MSNPYQSPANHSLPPSSQKSPDHPTPRDLLLSVIFTSVGWSTVGTTHYLVTGETPRGIAEAGAWLTIFISATLVVATLMPLRESFKTFNADSILCVSLAFTGGVVLVERLFVAFPIFSPLVELEAFERRSFGRHFWFQFTIATVLGFLTQWFWIVRTRHRLITICMAVIASLIAAFLIKLRFGLFFL